MLNAANRMKLVGKQEDHDSGTPASIFGSAAGLAQSIQTDEQFRISVYPVVCNDLPEIAMGLASCLCYLLEQYQDMRVYRCFARIAVDDSGVEVTRDDFQFAVSDWELEGLSDNVRIWGTLERSANGFMLQLSLDLSLLELDSDSDTLEYRFESLTDAVSALPNVASDINGKLGGGSREQAIISYTPLAPTADEVVGILELVFDWNLDVYLTMWAVDWQEPDIREQLNEVAELCRKYQNEFAFWCLGMIARQVMQPGLESIGDIVAELVEQSFTVTGDSAPGAAAAALGFSSLGYVQRAVEFLDPHLNSDADAGIWNSMIDIHLEAGKIDEAIDTNQRALEYGLEHAALYWRYAQLLITAEANDWSVEDVLLIEPDEHDEEEHIQLEIANALKLYLAHRPDDLSALQLALTYMIDTEDEEVWIHFERLVQSDDSGLYTGDIIDRLLDIEDHDQAYDLLEEYLDANPFAYVFRAQLALADSDMQLAADTIEECRSRFSQMDEDLELELQHLELRVKLPSFEEDFAEIKVTLNANRLVPENRVELLEQAIEIAPKMIDLYLLLSRCYRSWKDNESAYEVLQEAERKAGAHPQIELGLAQILWMRNEQTEAVSKLNTALELFPSDVYLLIQLANYLIENGQFDDARAYIALAETIAPSHRAIWQVRRLVAQKMAQ